MQMIEETRNPPPGVDGPRSYWQRHVQQRGRRAAAQSVPRPSLGYGEFERRRPQVATAGYGNDAAKIVRHHSKELSRSRTCGSSRAPPGLFRFLRGQEMEYFLFMQKEDPAGIENLAPEKVDEMKNEYEAIVPNSRQDGYVRTSWCKVSVRDRAEAVWAREVLPMFYAQAQDAPFRCGGTRVQGSEQALDVEVAPSSGGVRNRSSWDLLSRSGRFTISIRRLHSVSTTLSRRCITLLRTSRRQPGA